MSKILSILSGKGGVGKTTLSINLAFALHKLGEDVLLMDGNLQNPNIALQLGVFNYTSTVQDILMGKSVLPEGLHIHQSGLRFIPASSALSYLNTDPTAFKEILRDSLWFTLIDSPPLITRDCISIIKASDEILVVTTPYLPDVTDCMRVIEVVKSMNKRVRGIVLNKVRGKNYEISAKEISAISGVEVIHSIPWDENIMKSIAYKRILTEWKPFSKASIAIFELAEKLSGRKFIKPRFLWIRKFLW